jgi:hypothetical protein
MRVIFIIWLILLSTDTIAQQPTENIKTLNVKVPYYPCIIRLEHISFKQEYKISRSTAGLTIKQLGSGNYQLLCTSERGEILLKDSINISAGQDLILNLTYDSCLYDYPVGYVPECPKSHKNKIVPIIYGLVATLIPKNGNKIPIKSEPTYYSGGCVISECDPKYYCTIHQIKF